MTESTVSLKLCHGLKGIENECLTSSSGLSACKRPAVPFYRWVNEGQVRGMSGSAGAWDRGPPRGFGAARSRAGRPVPVSGPTFRPVAFCFFLEGRF